MALIQPLTDISAGGAQVFDTSGFAGLYQRQEAEKDAKFDKLAKESLEYDPSGLFDKDVPIYKQLMTDYQDFVANNNEALVSPSDNMDVWRQKQKLENRIKNYVAGSKQKNQEYGVALQRFSSDPAWMNEYNIDYLDKVNKGTTLEDFDKGIGFMDILEGMERNLDNIKPLEQYASMVEKHMATVKEQLSGVEGLSDTQRKIMTTENLYEYPEEQVKQALGTLFEQKNAEANELAYKYRDKEDPLDAFYEDVMSWTRKHGGEKISGFGGGGAEDAPTGAYSVRPQKGSSQAVAEQHYVMDKKGNWSVKVGDEEGGTESSFGLATVGKAANVFSTTSGEVLPLVSENILINASVTEGMDMRTGKAIDPKEGKNYKTLQVLELGKFLRATGEIDIETKDGDVIKIEPGTYLPDITSMKNEGVISQETYNDLILMMSGQDRKIIPSDGVVVFASPEEVDILQMEQGEDALDILRSGGGGTRIIMPLSKFRGTIANKLNKTYPDLAAATGDVLGHYQSQMTPISLLPK